MKVKLIVYLFTYIYAVFEVLGKMAHLFD